MMKVKGIKIWCEQIVKSMGAFVKLKYMQRIKKKWYGNVIG